MFSVYNKVPQLIHSDEKQKCLPRERWKKGIASGIRKSGGGINLFITLIVVIIS